MNFDEYLEESLVTGGHEGAAKMHLINAKAHVNKSSPAYHGSMALHHSHLAKLRAEGSDMYKHHKDEAMKFAEKASGADKDKVHAFFK